ncbi:lysophospholipid acyltransferase family protein [Nocardioides taihuensis]|uniref:Lysophospholipid acyltransferase family protein n=1 Tax=Nocardioides taihuensis TaxID=1835606 RepID=A0ABW0BK51_9ACTN
MWRPFLLRRTLARVLLRLTGWKTVGTVPKRGILVGAPHTSNWDWVLTMLLAWDSGVQIRLLVKDAFFKGPLAPVMRATGAVELDRANPGATIRSLLEDAESDETFLLGIAAEGTRSRGEYWKSGFYRISQQTGLPITLAFLDGPSKTVGWGPTFPTTGDVAADMDRIRDFYADKIGLKPGGATPPRLKEEGR